MNLDADEKRAMSSHDTEPDTPSCWVIFNNAHDVFRAVVNEMEYDIRSGEISRFEMFPGVWRQFQKFSTLHADMEECGFYRLLVGNSSKIFADLVSWELHQADSDAMMRVDNMLAKYQGRGEVFDKILPIFLEWQDVHFRHLDYEDEVWKPIINDFNSDHLRRNRIVYHMVIVPAHLRDPDLCRDYYAWITKTLSLYGTKEQNPRDSTIAFVRGLRCVCDASQWSFYLPSIRDACTISIWDCLSAQYSIEQPDENSSFLNDNSIFENGSTEIPPESRTLLSYLIPGSDNHRNRSNSVDDGNSSNSAVESSKRFSINIVDLNIARASFALVGTRGSFFQQKKIIPGTEWWTDIEKMNSGKETAAIMSDSHSFHSNSINGMVDARVVPDSMVGDQDVTEGVSQEKPSTGGHDETSYSFHHQILYSSTLEKEKSLHPEQDEFHFNRFILPVNKNKPASIHLMRGISTLPEKLQRRPVVFSGHASMFNDRMHYIHPGPFRSRVVGQIFSSWTMFLNCFTCRGDVDDVLPKDSPSKAHHSKKKSSKKHKKKDKSHHKHRHHNPHQEGEENEENLPRDVEDNGVHN